MHKLRAKLIGKWLNANGEVLTFTDGGNFIITSPELQANPKMPKEITATFVLTEDLQLKVITNTKPVISEFSVDSELLRIKTKSGDFAEYRHYSNKAVAELILRDLRILDSAVDQWAIELNKKVGDRPTPADVRKYLPKNSRLSRAFADPAGPKDLLGNPYGELVVDQLPKVNPATARALSDVPKTFWEKFID